MRDFAVIAGPELVKIRIAYMTNPDCYSVWDYLERYRAAENTVKNC